MEKVRLINILAGLYDADPADILWDDSGSCDVIQFTTNEEFPKRYVLKLSQDNTGVSGSSVCDFRVRVIAVEDANPTNKKREAEAPLCALSASSARATGRVSR